VYGLITLVIGMGGVVTGGWLAGRLRRAGFRDANWRVMLFDIVLLVPCATVAPLMTNPALAMTVLAVAVFGATLPYGVAAAALQDITPNQLRAQASALYLFGLGLLGLGLGPAGVGFATDRIFSDPMAVGRSISLVCGIAGPLAIVFLAWGWGSYRRLLDEPAR
jgi:MFS family permease